MKVLDYRKRPQLPGRWYAPEAVMAVAEAKNGSAWANNPARDYLPAYQPKGQPFTREFVRKKERFYAKTRNLKIPKSRLGAFAEARKMFRDARRLLTNAILGGSLTAELWLGDVDKKRKIDRHHAGLLLSQALTIFCTGYVRLSRGRSHGYVLFKKEDIQRLVDGYGDPAHSAKGQFSGVETEQLNAFAQACRNHFSPVRAFTMKVLTSGEAMAGIKSIALGTSPRSVEISMRQFEMSVKAAFSAAGIYASGGRPKSTSVSEKELVEFVSGYGPTLATGPATPISKTEEPKRSH